MINLPPLTPPRWTQQQALAFESARECLSDMIAICVAEVCRKEGKGSPDAGGLAELEAELAGLLAERRALSLTDDEAVAMVRERCGEQVREFRDRQACAHLGVERHPGVMPTGLGRPV